MVRPASFALDKMIACSDVVTRKPITMLAVSPRFGAGPGFFLAGFIKKILYLVKNNQPRAHQSRSSTALCKLGMGILNCDRQAPKGASPVCNVGRWWWCGQSSSTPINLFQNVVIPLRKEPSFFVSVFPTITSTMFEHSNGSTIWAPHDSGNV